MSYAAFRSEEGPLLWVPGFLVVCLFFLQWLHPFPWNKWVHSWAEAHISLSDWPLGILLPRTPCLRAHPSLRWSYLDPSFWSGSKLWVQWRAGVAQCWRVAQGWLLGVDGALACSEVTTHNHKKPPRVWTEPVMEGGGGQTADLGLVLMQPCSRALRNAEF